MTYTTTREKYGRSEMVIDLARFAADLAAALGGTVETDKDAVMGNHRIVLEGMKLSLSANHYHTKDKVEVSALPIFPRDGDWPIHHGPNGTFTLPSMKVSPDRPMPAIVRDIRKRVIDAAVRPIANIAEHVATRRSERAWLEAATAELLAAVPEMRVYHSQDNGYSKDMYWNGEGTSLDATMHLGGTVSIRRLEGVPSSTFVEMCEVLRRHAKR
jgi:hypothetical protein